MSLLAIISTVLIVSCSTSPQRNVSAYNMDFGSNIVLPEFDDNDFSFDTESYSSGNAKERLIFRAYINKFLLEGRNLKACFNEGNETFNSPNISIKNVTRVRVNSETVANMVHLTIVGKKEQLNLIDRFKENVSQFYDFRVLIYHRKAPNWLEANDLEQSVIDDMESVECVSCSIKDLPPVIMYDKDSPYRRYFLSKYSSRDSSVTFVNNTESLTLVPINHSCD